MKIKFIPQNIEIDIDSNKSVMELAHENGIYIKSICNGMPSCAECRVKVSEGEYNILPPAKAELALIGSGYFIDHRRLSCQMHCFGNMVIDLSEQIEKEKSSTHRRPQGNLKKESTEKSLAVTGSLIEEDEELIQKESVRIERSQRVSDATEASEVFLVSEGLGSSSSDNDRKRKNRKKRSGGSRQRKKNHSRRS